MLCSVAFVSFLCLFVALKKFINVQIIVCFWVVCQIFWDLFLLTFLLDNLERLDGIPYLIDEVLARIVF